MSKLVNFGFRVWQGEENNLLTKKSTSEELKKKVKKLDNEAVEIRQPVDSLRDSEELAKASLDATSDMVFLTDIRGNILIVNDMAARRLGKAPEELIGTNLFDYFPPDIAMSRKEKADMVVDSGKPLHFQDEREGRVSDISIYPTFDEQKNVDRLAVFGTDITERKRSEAILRENEIRFRELFNNIPSGVAVYEAKGQGEDFIFKDFNRAGELLEDIRKEELIGKSVKEIFPGVKELGLFDVLQRVLKTGRPEHHPITHYKDERLSGWRDNFVYKLPTGEIVAIYTDETKKRQAEEALRESEEKYRTLFGGVSDALALIEVKTGNMIEVNQAFVDLYGYSKTEVLSLKNTAFSAEPDETWIATQEPKTVIPVRWHKKKDGTVFPVEITATVFDYSGREVLIAAIRDITDRKQAEEEKVKLEKQLRQTQKMEAIGTLAGGIAHDFNNILGSVLGYTELAMDHAEEGSVLEDCLDELFTAGKRARKLVKQILTFSRQGEQEQKPVQIQFITKEALKLLRASLPSTVEIRQNIVSDFLVMCDSTQIHQVMMNLCTNAGQAMQETGGVLDIELVDVEIDSAFAAIHLDIEPGPYVQLTVSDTGHGMSQELLDQIFNPFFTTKKKGAGTGMGLSVVHGIVTSYGGSINVASELGKGTTFKLYFPANKSKVGGETKIEKSIPNGFERILFVDDEQALVKLGKHTLESLGYTVTTRHSSIDALALFKTSPTAFDLVITDMTMPNMTGDELAKKLMAIRPDIPIIVCTGFSTRITEKKIKSLGIRALVSKPILKSDIAETIRKVLDQGEIQGASVRGCILLVDDDDQLRGMLRKMLEGEGHEIVEAPDGKVAVKLYRERPLDLIITDLIMPEKEGLELITELKHDFPDVKIIAISGGGRIGPAEYLPIAKKFGASYTFEKPFNQEEILKAVQDILSEQ